LRHELAIVIWDGHSALAPSGGAFAVVVDGADGAGAVEVGVDHVDELEGVRGAEGVRGGDGVRQVELEVDVLEAADAVAAAAAAAGDRGAAVAVAGEPRQTIVAAA